MILRTIFSTLLLASITPAVAQEAAVVMSPDTLKPERRHDVSLFGQHGGPLREGDGYFVVSGGIYRWQKQGSSQTFYKLGAGFGSAFNITSRRTVPVSADSAFDVTIWNPQRVALLLAGVETQRRLRKSIFLTAGLEAQVGGTDGRLDSLAHRVPIDQSPHYAGPAVRVADTRRYFGAGLALLGIRASAGRVTAAVELFTGLQMSARMEKREGSDFTIFDLGLGRSGGRLSFGYRF